MLRLSHIYLLTVMLLFTDGPLTPDIDSKTINKKTNKLRILTYKYLRMLLVLASCILAVSAQAAKQHPQREKIQHQLPHFQTKIEIDGKISEAVWSKALVVELNYETSPAENSVPPVKTTAYLYEDGETLYVAFDARDDNPEQIRDFLLDRDNIWRSDFVGIKFDTFGESRKAFQFFTNARGIQADAIQEDFRGDDSTWDAIWQSKALITSRGYQVEMAIPFTALRFPATGQQQSWGMEILRFYPRNEVQRFANSPLDRSISCKICQYDQLLGFAQINESNNLRLVPTLVVAQSESRDSSAGSRWQSNDIDTSPGLDVRWGITPETYLNATINPDFSQVEADAAQLDINSTFSIFVHEKRPFFLDGSDYFNSLNRLVHTRDIIEPDYGLKITGQSEGHNYGAIIVNDNHTSFLLPSNQSSELLLLENQSSQNQILRYQYDFGNKNTLGMLATNKTGSDYSNRVASIDGKYWFNQEHSISYQLMHSNSHYSEQMLLTYSLENNDLDEPGIDQQDISDNAYAVKYDFETRDWKSKVSYLERGKDFRADLGFIRRVNFNKKTFELKRIWYPQKTNGWWNKLSLGGDWDQTRDIKGKKLEQEAELNFRMEGVYQSTYRAQIIARETLWDEVYFDEQLYLVAGSLEPRAGLKLSLNFSWGDSVDFDNSRLGESKRISPEINWQINQHSLTSLAYSRFIFNVAGGELFSAAIANFRLSYLFNERSSIRLTLQQVDIERDPSLYNSFLNDDVSDDVEAISKSLATQLLYTYRVNPQTLFFAGYSDDGFQDDSLNNIRKTFKTLFMKFSYAWQI